MVKSLVRSFLALLIGTVLHGHVLSQKDKESARIFALIYEARTNPQQFLQKYNEEIMMGAPRLALILKFSKPMKPAIWDAELEAICRNELAHSTKNPTYKGKNAICEIDGETHGGRPAMEGIQALLDFHTDLMDPNKQFFGMAFTPTGGWYHFEWGMICNPVSLTYEFKGAVDSSKVDFSKLNTAKDEAYLSASEKRMILEINFVRTYPKVYAQIVAQQLENQSNSPDGLTFTEYIAGRDLIEELNHLGPIGLLQPRQCAFEAAKRRANECAERGFLNEVSGNMNPFGYINTSCKDIDGIEDLYGGNESDPRSALIGIMTSGGLADRGSRFHILHPEWKYIGSYLIPNTTMKDGTDYNWVQTFAQEM